jgi:hypothetical protein
MQTDSAQVIGHRHAAVAGPSQDYATSGVDGGLAWAVVADGCSTAGETDLGARAWALAARKILRSHPEALGWPARDWTHQLLLAAEPTLSQLPLSDGFATLGVLGVKSGSLRAMFWGDGVLLLARADGTLSYFVLSYENNAPFYLNYARQPGALNAWGSPKLTVFRTDVSTQGVVLGTRELTTSVIAPWELSLDLSAEPLRGAILCTDGVTDVSGQLTQAVLQGIADIRSPSGMFLRRKLARLVRDWSKTGARPEDDLSLSGIWLPPDNSGAD